MSASKLSGTLLLILAIALLSLFTVLNIFHKNNEANQKNRVSLPSDVDNVIKDFKFSDIRKDGNTYIYGKQLVRRGKKMFGLRSTVVKTTMLDMIQGRFSSSTHLVTFSASEGEWETSPDLPLDLKNNVIISLDRRQLNNVERAKIYFNQGRIVTFGTKRDEYRFK